MSEQTEDRVSRSRFERERSARQQAESLLEEKSRELYLANEKLSKHSVMLEDAVVSRTAELRSALEKAEAASETRARFIATMSHEIRTPLGGLLGMIDLMYGDETDASKLELLTYAKTSGEALKRIVNDVLDFSKMEAGAFQFENEKVDLRALVGGVVALAGTSLPAAGERLRTSISSTVPQYFAGDATRIRQVIANLVSNAARYSTEGKIEVRAFAFPQEKGSLVRIEVEDEGIGISPDQQKDLFKDFTQVPNKLTAAAQGTGLGLAISRRIIEGAGGRIGVLSEHGVGSTFWFELPVEEIHDEEAVDRAANPKSTSRRMDVSGARILLAEDNKINQKLILTFLKRMNLTTDLAENGREAVELFAPGKYDLVLMDVAMPEMDGLEATRIIRESWAPEQVPPIVILTAHVLEAIHKESAQVGIDRVLSKPITFADLRDAISEELGSSPIEPVAPPEKPAGRPVVFEELSQPILQGLVDVMGEAEVVGLIKEFVVDAKRGIDAMSTAFGAGNRKIVASEAHAIKGMSGLIGAHVMSELAGELEQNASSLGEKSFAEITTALNDEISKFEGRLQETAS